MKRGRAAPGLVLVLALAACAAPAPPPPAPVVASSPPAPPPPTPPPPPALHPADLVGAPASAISALFGAPDLLRREPPAQVWRYARPACVVHVFIYAPPGGGGQTEHSERVEHVEIDLHRPGLDRPGCLDRLRKKAGQTVQDVLSLKPQ